MTVLPDEIWTDILDYLDPPDLVSSQRVSRRLLKLARDSPLWRNKVFEKAPSASRSRATNANALSALTGALGGLSLGDPPLHSIDGDVSQSPDSTSRASRRARAVLEWDASHPTENPDWYSEYIARHAPLATVWAKSSTPQHEIRGMALLGDTGRVISTLENGSLGIWDVQQSQDCRRKITQLARSRPGLLFEDMYSLGESSLSTKSKSLGATVENISVDSKQKKTFVAVGNVLNEIDLERMEIISQNKFAWPITALSQENNTDNNLTIGTSFSLHIHDQRLPFLKLTDNSERLDGDAQSRIAFLQNWTKGIDVREADVSEESTEVFRDSQAFTNRLETFARIEPGPQSILHRDRNEIIIAGRMPSILLYDRRNFPKPRTGIHSGARLSALTTLPVPPAKTSSAISGGSTLIACGEYGGRGSLEIYELPWDKRASFRSSNQVVEHEKSPRPVQEPFSFRNRQEASSSKLLSVATQGTRIVFSDSEGMLKWVERDGHGLARRWNINSFQMHPRGGAVSGDKVVRKMIALPETQTERGMRGDGDLLIWTGENIGLVTTKPQPVDDHDDLVQAFERGMNLNAEQHGEERDAEYSTMMRRALERQADERRWMSRFGVRRW